MMMMMMVATMRMRMMMMMMGNTGSWAWEQLSLKAFPFFDTLMKCKIICLNGQKLSLDEVDMPLLWLTRCIKIKLISIPGPSHWNSPRENYSYDIVAIIVSIYKIIHILFPNISIIR